MGKKLWNTSRNKKSITARPAFKTNSGSSYTRMEWPSTSSTFGIDCPAPDLAPKGRSNEAQANGLGLDGPNFHPPALKGRHTCSPMPQSLDAHRIADDRRCV